MIRKTLRILGLIAAGLLGLLLLALAISAVINRTQPTTSADPDHLDPVALARLDEFAHLQTTLGDAVWPGFGDRSIPVVVYNEQNAFLAGLADPAPGWQTVPGGRSVGGPWQPADGAAPAFGPLYVQMLPADGETPQAFTVRLGDTYAASLGTMEWMRLALAQQIRGELPPIVSTFFPYPLFTRQLVSGSDQYVSVIAHEAFHAHQATVAPARVAAAEAGLRAHEADYPWDDEAVIANWQTELDLLAAALEASTRDETAALAEEFLAVRDDRRRATGLSAGQIDFERQREWLEGLARYVELAIWREAATAPGYEAVDTLSADPEFDNYSGYDRRWQREIDQLRRMADDPGEGRFYYTGSAIATLLDRLSPGWKTRALEPGVQLEDLLAEAIG